jgi:hypothetical protein
MENKKRYRLVTRSNLDGIISATLLKKIDEIDEISLVHPKDVQDGKIKITENDIVANLPYVKNAHMAFDYNLDTTKNGFKLNPNHALFTDAHSVSEIIYEYYGAKEVFDEQSMILVKEANRSKIVDYSKDEILNPKGWTLLNFITDPRTGLGRFNKFRISNYELMLRLSDDLCNINSIDEILALDDVKERIDFYKASKQDFIDQLKKCTKIEGDVAILDLREEDIIYPGNRFMLYALFPEITASIHVLDGLNSQNTVFALGKSIINKDNTSNIFDIVSTYDGGGHKDAGTCQVSHQEAQNICNQLVKSLKSKELETV